MAKDQRTFIEENLGDNDVLKKADSDRNTNIKVRFIQKVARRVNELGGKYHELLELS